MVEWRLLARGLAWRYRPLSVRSARALLTIIFTMGVAAHAQSPSDPSDSAASVPATCLARSFVGERSSAVAGAKAESDIVAIAVPQDKVDRYAKRGFAPVKCATAQLISREQRAEICTFAPARDPAMNAYFWQRFGFTPFESCNVLKDIVVAK